MENDDDALLTSRLADVQREAAASGSTGSPAPLAEAAEQFAEACALAQRAAGERDDLRRQLEQSKARAAKLEREVASLKGMLREGSEIVRRQEARVAALLASARAAVGAQVV